jgi:hypothetical protein
MPLSAFELPDDSLDDLYPGHTDIAPGTAPRLYIRGAKIYPHTSPDPSSAAQLRGETSAPASVVTRPQGRNRGRSLDATWGRLPQSPDLLSPLKEPSDMAETTQRQITLESWRPFVKNTLRGFATVRLPFGGATLMIKELTVHRKGDRVWVSFPAKPRLSSDGTPQKDTDGKIMYDNLLQWTDKEHGDRFSVAVVELIEKFHPGAVS